MARSKKRRLIYTDQRELDLNHVVITTGSPEGVGSEIVSRALSSLKPSAKIRYSVFFQEKALPIRLSSQWALSNVSLSQAGHWRQQNQKTVQIVTFRSSAAKMVSAATKFCLEHSGSSLVNAPMRKLRTGEGHTEIIKKLSGYEDLVMGFVGKKFNVCLATTHVPLDQVTGLLTDKRVQVVAKAAMKLHHMTGRSEDPIGILGLNPHAGENGAISTLDQKLYKTLLKTCHGQNLSSLLPPDGAFAQGVSYRTLVAWYHDQGLIPFKLIHGLSQGIQITLGIPFVRTSVDHGTAENLKGSGLADFRSMRMAIQWAGKLGRTHGNTLF